MIQWLGLFTITAKGAGLIPGWGNKILQTARRGQKLNKIKKRMRGEESRWRRDRTGRSLSLLQIHRKNNLTVNKVHKTTSDS